jgi:hypothetical protein
MATSNMWNSVSPMLTGLMGSPVESMYGGVTGYTPGAEPMPIYKNPPQNTPATPAPIDDGFYNSQIYKDYQNNPANMMGGYAMTYSPYFGQQTSDDGGARDRAYEQYLASIGKPVNNPSTVDFNLFNRLSGGGTAASPGGLAGMLGGAFQPYMPVAGGFDLRNQADFALANSPQSYEQYVATPRAIPGDPLSRERYEQEQAAAIARVNNFTPDMLNMLNKENSPANMLGGAPASNMNNTNNFTPDMFNMLNGGNSSGNMLVGAPSSGAPNTVRFDHAGVNNQNNLSFNPTPIDSSGSYNTSDWLSVLGGLATGGLTGAASGAGVNDAVARLQALGQSGMTDYTNLAKTATEGINFTPYTLTSSLGTTQQTAPGVISQQLTPQQQANVNAAQQQQASLYGAAVPDTSGISQGAFTGAQSQLGQVGANQQDLAALRAGYGTAAQGMTGMLGGSTTGMADQLFQQQQAMRSPVQQRQQLELENRLRAQGRLGTSTAAYGGTPEQLAMAKAVQEQQSADAFNSMTQAEQMATSQQARALGLGSATSTLAQAQQALRQGDIANAQGLFNIGSAAAQLPQQMQGQNIAQAGQLQSQALAPAAAQLQQAQLAGTMGQQRAQTGYQAGGLFASTAGAGLQERLTAESAAAALRGKQYTSALGALANKGGATGTAANTVQQLLSQGITKVGDELFDAGGKLLGSAAELLGSSTASLWDGIGNIFDTDAQFETDWQAALDGQLTSGDSNLISGTIDSISSGVSAAWDWTKNLFGF